MKTALAAILCASVLGCTASQDLRPNTEFVLSKGMSISATTPNGRVVITGGSGTIRTFSGDGWTKERTLIPRNTRWYGSLGLYDPADSFSPYGRIIIDEGRQFFDSESEALRYLYSGSNLSKPVFNNRGLVVVYEVEAISGGEPVRRIQVWQIYIKGRRPQSMNGADDTAVKVDGGEIPDVAVPNPATVGYPRVLGKEEYVPEKTKS